MADSAPAGEAVQQLAGVADQAGAPVLDHRPRASRSMPGLVRMSVAAAPSGPSREIQDRIDAEFIDAVRVQATATIDLIWGGAAASRQVATGPLVVVVVHRDVHNMWIS
ncbi:hypothetical protein ACIGO9_15220 [Nocardia asteroides]|uniref:hypothetical protein n=1 Tax=Nocardia asteroides TaxID=1824 RepID=UPI0037C76A2E